MIRMKQPSLVVHSHDVPGYKYQMKWTWKMLPGTTAGDIVNWVLHANNGQFGARHQRLENIIINCHGSPGSLYVGGVHSADLNIGNVGVFSSLQSCDIGTIWLVACEVAAQQGVATGGGGGGPPPPPAHTTGGAGNPAAPPPAAQGGLFLRRGALGERSRCRRGAFPGRRPHPLRATPPHRVIRRSRLRATYP